LTCAPLCRSSTLNLATGVQAKAPTTKVPSLEV